MARVAVVTGGTRGIGAIVSEQLKAKGYNVAAIYSANNEAANKFNADSGIATYKVDVSDFNDCQAGITQIEADLGPVEVLVNNAGITRDGTLHRMKAENWQAVIDTIAGHPDAVGRVVSSGLRGRVTPDPNPKGIGARRPRCPPRE